MNLRVQSDLEPLDNPPRNFTGGTIGEGAVSCESGGSTIEMAALTIDLNGGNPCTFSDDDDDDDNDDGGQTASGSSGCNLSPDGSGGAMSVAVFMVVFFASLTMLVSRRKRCCVKR